MTDNTQQARAAVTPEAVEAAATEGERNDAEAMGARIVGLRTGMGWSQPAFARVLSAAGFKSTSQAAISRIERGERSITIHEGYILADVFGITIDELAGREALPAIDGASGLREAIRILTSELERRTS